MTETDKYLFGPVPSRRLGLSLGVDIVPFKVCTLDCIYCQVGRTTEKTSERKEYVSPEPVLAELKARLEKGLTADYITLSGSGEPTLNSRLGDFLDGIKKLTDIPVAILTNGTMFSQDQVRSDCAKADLVLPSLDAADEQTFELINRPCPDISIENVVSGLSAFREEFTGRIWLEVFFVDGVNTESEQISKIKDAIKHIRPDKVQLNTAVRPTAVAGVKMVRSEHLHLIARQLGKSCEVIADFSHKRCLTHTENQAQIVLSILKRRPCSLEDVCAGLGLHPNEALKYISHFQKQGLVESEQKDGTIFYKVV